MAARKWRCRSCMSMNEPRTRKCGACDRKRPPRRRAKHLAAKLSYEEHVKRNGGEWCGICGNPPKEGGKRLHRDHDHVGAGMARGVLCFRCNAAVRTYMTLEWSRALVAYLERFTNQTEES